MSTPNLFSVVGLLMRDGKILAVSRKMDHSDLGLPGGKIDPGESPEEAIRREIWEEVGVRVGAVKPIFDHLDRVEEGESRPCRCFAVESWDGEPASQEGARVAWVSPNSLITSACSFRAYNRALFAHTGIPFDE